MDWEAQKLRGPESAWGPASLSRRDTILVHELSIIRFVGDAFRQKFAATCFCEISYEAKMLMSL